MNKTLRILFKKRSSNRYVLFNCLGKLLLDGNVEINDFETVNTSFPKFLKIHNAKNWSKI